KHVVWYFTRPVSNLECFESQIVKLVGTVIIGCHLLLPSLRGHRRHSLRAVLLATYRCRNGGRIGRPGLARRGLNGREPSTLTQGCFLVRLRHVNFLSPSSPGWVDLWSECLSRTRQLACA